MKYQVGETVETKTPNGWCEGRVTKIHERYMREGDLRYEIEGPKIHTVCRESSIRPLRCGQDRRAAMINCTRHQYGACDC